MNNKKIYHLHIPRTSGKSICDALRTTFDKGMVSGAPLHDYGNLQMYDDSFFLDRPYISGHFGVNPIIKNKENLDVFSIVREPVNHYLSVAAYVACSAKEKMSNEFLEEFLYGNITPFGSNELFSNSGNIQSKMLFCRMAMADISVVALRDDDVSNELNIVFIESDMPNEKEMVNKIREMNIFAMQNRHHAISWLDNKLRESYGLSIDSSINEISNCSNMNGFVPDKSHIKEIKNRSEFDTYVHQVVTERGRISA